MKKKIFFIVLAMVLVVLLIYCGYAGQPLPVESNDSNKAFAADINDINAVAVGSTDFAFELYGKLTDASVQNMLIWRILMECFQMQVGAGSTKFI
jgi:hypothetical protein